ncbi:MAG: Dabb family protein [Muribaculaceae bacterium]|nr:Dabb family protein [Muribaculaceae bacterium]
MVNHVVTFKFKGDAQTRLEVAKKFKAALDELPRLINELQSIEVGINQNPKEDWDLTLTAKVASMEDVATYAVHPAHVAAVQIIKDHKEARACVDYITE